MAEPNKNANVKRYRKANYAGIEKALMVRIDQMRQRNAVIFCPQ